MKFKTTSKQLEYSINLLASGLENQMIDFVASIDELNRVDKDFLNSLRFPQQPEDFNVYIRSVKSAIQNGAYFEFKGISSVPEGYQIGTTTNIVTPQFIVSFIPEAKDEAKKGLTANKVKQSETVTQEEFKEFLKERSQSLADKKDAPEKVALNTLLHEHFHQHMTVLDSVTDGHVTDRLPVEREEELATMYADKFTDPYNELMNDTLHGQNITFREFIGLHFIAESVEKDWRRVNKGEKAAYEVIKQLYGEKQNKINEFIP